MLSNGRPDGNLVAKCIFLAVPHRLVTNQWEIIMRKRSFRSSWTGWQTRRCWPSWLLRGLRRRLLAASGRSVTENGRAHFARGVAKCKKTFPHGFRIDFQSVFCFPHGFQLGHLSLDTPWWGSSAILFPHSFFHAFWLVEDVVAQLNTHVDLYTYTKKNIYTYIYIKKQNIYIHI